MKKFIPLHLRRNLKRRFARRGPKKNSFSYASGFLPESPSTPPDMCRRDAIFSQSTITFRNNHKLCYAHVCGRLCWSPSPGRIIPKIRFMIRQLSRLFLFSGCHNSGHFVVGNFASVMESFLPILTRPEAQIDPCAIFHPGAGNSRENKLNNINICEMRRAGRNNDIK